MSTTLTTETTETASSTPTTTTTTTLTTTMELSSLHRNPLKFFGRAQFDGIDHLTLPEGMTPSDKALFQQSLKVQSDADLRKAALLWEDYFLPKYPSPFFMIRVADVHVTLNSPTTALPIYEEAKDYLSSKPSTGRSFQQYLDEFQQKVQKWVMEQADLVKGLEFPEGLAFKPARQRRFPTNLYAPPESASEIRITNFDSALWSKFINFMLIETNQVEGVFLISRASMKDIDNKGVSAGMIESLPESALHDKAAIREMLNDTMATYAMLDPIVKDTSLLTPETIKQVHATMMKSSRIDVKSSRYVNAGRTRAATKKEVFIKGEVYNVGCCPAKDVDRELEYICGQARQWIKTWGDVRSPFAVAAWLHVIIAQCHPFEDGNGRMARFLASIPLLRQNYPPICISTNFAGRYHAALKKGFAGSYDDLAYCFVESTVNAINEVGHLL